MMRDPRKIDELKKLIKSESKKQHYTKKEVNDKLLI